MLFTERPGRLRARLPDGSLRTLTEPDDLLVTYETGLMGLAVSPSFSIDHAVYTCQSHAPTNTAQVVRWTVSPSWAGATRNPLPLVSGIPAGADTGGHAGCRVRFDATDQLLVGTGDAYTGTVPQDLTSLGGKVLRVDPATGAGSFDNPFASSTDPDTRRVYTFGHRNVQGLALRPSAPGLPAIYSVEHGPTWDDEVNRLVAGGNYGWNPVPGYNQSVPMTDLELFPDAVEAVWSSGAYSLATSGGTFIDGPAWGNWDGALVVGALKTTHLRVIKLDADDETIGQTTTLTGYGRLRTPVMGPDGSLYVTTSNGEGSDRILRLTPQT
ncbi:MAG: PQQ-dependent sugar dehydrogenase [Acidimicrobiia bacterium]|nr:PQQ-dependent sugar dehydrogenase [Acidimicrobiia bacterium]